jgi:hypothetical protein
MHNGKKLLREIKKIHMIMNWKIQYFNTYAFLKLTNVFDRIIDNILIVLFYENL